MRSHKQPQYLRQLPETGTLGSPTTMSSARSAPLRRCKRQRAERRVCLISAVSQTLPQQQAADDDLTCDDQPAQEQSMPR